MQDASAGYMSAGSDIRPGISQPWVSTDQVLSSADDYLVRKEAPEQLHPELEFKMQLGKRIRKQFHKTQYCRYHLTNGCRKGASCEFAHSRKELSVLPDLRRTSICKDWLDGKCQLTAENCDFAHGSAWLRRTFDNEELDEPIVGPESAASRSSATSSEPAHVSGERMIGGGGQSARMISSWEQRLLRQQVEQEEMKQTIMEQRKAIDALLRMQASGQSTQGNLAVAPQNASHVSPGGQRPLRMQSFSPQHFESQPPPSSQELLELACTEVSQNMHQIPQGSRQSLQTQQFLPQYSESTPLPRRQNMAEVSFIEQQNGAIVFHF